MGEVEDAGVNVLLVEDDPEDALLLREMLADVPSARFQLQRADSVGSALARLRDGRFHVVLLDLTLPDSAGLATFHAVHAQAPKVPVVVLTGLDDETVALRAVEEGAQDYLVKGQVSGPLLVRSMRYAIQRQRTSHYEALLVERERFDAAVSQMSDGIVVFDGAWRVTAANRAACLLLNLPIDDWRGLSLDGILQPFELSLALDDLRTADRRTDAFSIDRPHTLPPLLLDARLTRLFDATGTLANALLVVRDVTDQRREQALRADFLMMVSHKLRTPLAVLVACLDAWATLGPDGSSPELPELLAVCRREVARLTDTVQKLLDLKALPSSDPEAETRPTETADALAKAVAEARRRHPGKRVEASWEIAPGAEHAACDPGHFALVLGQLLDNAVKFADKDPVRVAVDVTAPDASALTVSLSDNGPGIPHEYYDRIFRGFVQVEDLPTGQVPGLGVGLYMARQIVHAYGGSIAVRSSLGEGTTITFTVPRASATGGAAAAAGGPPGT